METVYLEFDHRRANHIYVWRTACIVLFICQIQTFRMSFSFILFICFVRHNAWFSQQCFATYTLSLSIQPQHRVYIYTCMLIFNARRFLLSWANFNASMGFKPTENIPANITSYPIQYSFNCMHCDYDHGCWSAQVSEFSVRALQLFNLMILLIILSWRAGRYIISKFSVALTHTVPVLFRQDSREKNGVSWKAGETCLKKKKKVRARMLLCHVGMISDKGGAVLR